MIVFFSCRICPCAIWCLDLKTSFGCVSCSGCAWLKVGYACESVKREMRRGMVKRMSTTTPVS